jgi:hypothetical protein
LSFKDQKVQDEFLNDFYKSSFYFNIVTKKTNFDQEDFKNDIRQCNDFQSAILMSIKYFSHKGQNAKVYGDKTPDYLKHIAFLKKLFPNAKFLHIIRDPRDYCLSVKKIWGKSFETSAYSWHKEIMIARKVSKGFSKDYMEIKYEKLLTNTSEIMQDICTFINIPFEESMLRLSKPSENYGEAKGMQEVLSDNFQKYKKNISKKDLLKIEGIAYNEMISLGYQPIYAKELKRLSFIKFKFLKIYDGYKSMSFHINEKGLFKGLSYFIKLHQETSYVNK